jgi:hypothetical protein
MAASSPIAPSRSGMPLANADSPSPPDELLAQFKRIEQAWKTAEDKLAAILVPVDVRIKVDEEDEFVQGVGVVRIHVRYLAYCKVEGSRRVCVVHYTYSYRSYLGLDPDEPEVREETTPVTECPVDERLEMFDWFQKLYDEAKTVAGIAAIRDRVDKFLRKIEDRPTRDLAPF